MIGSNTSRRLWTTGVLACLAAVSLGQLPESMPSRPTGDAFADIDDTVRFVPSTQPDKPRPQRPPMATTRNVDLDRPIGMWQRLTDDWGGARPWLDDRGISIGASMTGDYSKVARGGVNTEDDDFANIINLNITLDTERLFKLKGGTFFVNYQHNGGTEVAENSGNFLGITNITADRRDELSEIWYEQVLCGEALRLKAGKIDVNSEFAASEHAGEFLNPSAEAPPTILSFPTFPDGAFGGLAQWNVTQHIALAGGAFDGALQEGRATGRLGPGTLFGDPADLFLIAEAGLTWTTRSLPGRLGVGAWRHTGVFDEFNGGTAKGTQGTYAVLDQSIYKEEPDNEQDIQGAGIFARISLADEDVAECKLHVACGGAWRGLIPQRDDDIIGAAAYWAKFSDSAPDFAGEGEFAVEVFYKCQLTRYLSVKPDVQYVWNPGGQGDVDDAIVASVRISLDF